jgi:hypothetical protein
MKPGTAKAIGWGLTYLALAGAIGLELDWGRRIHPSLPVPKPTPAARVDYPIQPEFTLRPLEQGFAETTARPIFTPGRHPPPPPAPPRPAMQKGQFVLMGALITQDSSIALLRNVATGKSIRVEKGKAINGITVANVYPEKVVLTQYDDTEELVLKIQPSPKPTAAPKAAPVQAVPAGAAGASATGGQTGATAPAPAPAPQSAANVPGAPVGSGNSSSLINIRRAARGLPPI